MPKVTTSLSNFSNGEISPLARGRFDLAKYANSAKVMLNFIVNQLGGGFFRQGTRYVASTKDNGVARLMPFQYSADQDYVMELGDLYARFYDNDAAAITITSWPSSYKYLLHGDGTDTSTNIIDEIGKSMTAVGDAQIDTAVAGKFGTGAIQFDGTVDKVTAPDSDDHDFGTGDFQIDFRVNFATVQPCGIIDVGSTQAGTKKGVEIQLSATNKWRVLINNAQVLLDAGAAPSQDTWYHIALLRNGTDLDFKVNGTSLMDVANSTDITGSTEGLTLGTSGAGTFLIGYLEEIRIMKGDTAWDADFTSPTTPYAKNSSTEVVTTYLEADLFELMQAHRNDVKYVTHENYIPRKISRTDATTFAIADVDFVRGPFLDDNITAVTLNPSSATGATTITASSSTFTANHVGSLWRIKDGVVKMTAFTSVTEMDGTVQAEPDGTAGNLNGTIAVTDWAEGAFSAERGYPSAVAFHDGRLYYGGTTYEPQKIWGSAVSAFDSFDADDATDDDAVTFEIATEERNAILWMMSSRRSLAVGTTGGTFSVSGASEAPITPDSIQVTRDTTYGVTSIAPKRLSSFIYYIQRNLNKLREISFNFDIDSNIARDMTLLADHILKDGSGAIDMDYQQSPNDRMWCVRDDGILSVLTRNPEQEVTGWCRLKAGTDSTTYGKFESVVVIPKQDTEDQVWVIVNRKIGGTTKRFLEFFTAEDFDDDFDAVRLDSSVTKDSALTITAVTKANPPVVTSASHGLSNGDQIKIDNVVGMTELNGNTYLIADKTDHTFELQTTGSVDVDGSAYTTYISGGEAREMVVAMSGLGHLEGEVVEVQADGVALTATSTVSGGAITLASKAAVTHIGLPYDGTIQLLKFSDGSATGTGQTKNRRIFLSTIRVDRSLSMKIGKSETTLDEVFFGATNATDVTDLFTGDLEKFYQTWWAKDDEIILRQDIPSPLNILSIITRSEVTE